MESIPQVWDKSRSDFEISQTRIRVSGYYKEADNGVILRFGFPALP
jgi:hypothetical protein